MQSPVVKTNRFASNNYARPAIVARMRKGVAISLYLRKDELEDALRPLDMSPAVAWWAGLGVDIIERRARLKRNHAFSPVKDMMGQSIYSRFIDELRTRGGAYAAQVPVLEAFIAGSVKVDLSNDAWQAPIKALIEAEKARLAA